MRPPISSENTACLRPISAELTLELNPPVISSTHASDSTLPWTPILVNKIQLRLERDDEPNSQWVVVYDSITAIAQAAAAIPLKQSVRRLTDDPQLQDAAWRRVLSYPHAWRKSTSAYKDFELNDDIKRQIQDAITLMEDATPSDD